MKRPVVLLLQVWLGLVIATFVPEARWSPTVVLYEQMDNPAGGIMSQNTPDLPSLSNQAADDFVVPLSVGAWFVDTVEVMGAYDPPNATPSVASVNVQFYADSGAGLPGALVYNTTVAPANIGNMATGDFVLTLTSPAALAPGTNWVSVQPNKNLSTGGWLWTERSVASSNPSAWREPNSLGACRNWAPRLATCAVGSYPDLIFRLNGTISDQFPPPTITSLNPSSAVAGGPAFALTVNGTYFANGSVVRWNGSDRPTAFANSTKLTASIPASDITTPMTASVTVFNPGPSGGESNAQIFTIEVADLYLPLVRKPRPGIHGLVTLNGASAAGVSLELLFFNGSSWSTLATTTTGADGGYSFTGIPSLGPGQRYYVLYSNTGGAPGRLWVWGTRELTSYTAGSPVEIGNFDIADIVLVAPTDGATVALPYTFRWTPRSATPLDTYEFDLYDPDNLDPYFYTAPPLGYVGSYTLNSLPAGFSPGVPYVWEMRVYSPDGGFGISYEVRFVTFSNTGLGAAEASSPLANPPVVSDREKQRTSSGDAGR